MTFYVLRGGRVVYPPGHTMIDDAERKALATLRRHPKSTVKIVSFVLDRTLEGAETAAKWRSAQRAALSTSNRRAKS